MLNKDTKTAGRGKTSSILRKSKRKLPLFVVQWHETDRPHFDLRLEADGVMKSWVLPKGPSMNPHEKRLALMIEDHDMKYARLNGAVPNGDLQAGTKMKIWDKGRWELTKNFKDFNTALSNGLLEFNLYGRHLKGNFILVEMEYSVDRNGWLLIKREDKEAVYTPYDAARIG